MGIFHLGRSELMPDRRNKCQEISMLCQEMEKQHLELDLYNQEML